MPFLVFAVPIVGSALHGAHATGYDRAGHVCPKLTMKQIFMKYQQDLQEGDGIDN